MDVGYFLVPFDDFYPSFNIRSGHPRRPRDHWRSRRWSPRGQLAHLDDKMFDMGNQLANFENDLRSTLARFGLGSVLSSNWLDFSPSVSVEAKVGGGTEDQGQKETGKFCMNIPLCGNIGPEDLKISLKDHVMTVEAKKEQKSEDGNVRVYQEFSKKITLPSSLDMKKVKSVLTPDGFLKIEAPLPLEALPEPKANSEQCNSCKTKKNTEVPIQQCKC